ncbi:hypothetical protein EDB87DRAFT_1647317, partial [Lactarius vividus]
SSPIPLIEMVSYPDREGHFFLLLDRTVVNRGTVVPQTMWSPRQRVEEAALQMPVFFDAQFVPLGQNSTTHVRIAWPDYKDFKCQVQIRDETGKHSLISISRFAHHIGQSVDAFFKAYEPDPGCTDNRRKQWEIGLCGIRRNDIMFQKE